jgi:hypothetical protein
MKRLLLAMISTLRGVLLIGTALASQEDEQTKISNGKLVNTLRLLNTNEMSYRNEKGRFADREELLEFLKTKNLLSKSPIDLQNPEA